MQIRCIFFGIVVLFASPKLDGYYPGYHGSDKVYATLMHQSIEATRSLENTIASRPHIHLANYHNHSTNTNYHAVNASKGDLTILHTNTINPQQQSAATVQPTSSDNLSIWQRVKGIFSLKKSASSFVKKCDIASKALVIGYAYINYRLFRLAHYNNAPERWHFWKQELSLAQLIELPQKELAQELVAQIRQRYGAPDNASAEANPFGIFMQQLEEEVAMLTSYQTFSNILLKVDDVEHRGLNVCCKYLPNIMGFSSSYIMSYIASKIRVKNLFYLDDTLLSLVPNRLSRLAYVKSVFVQWLAEHKVYAAKKMLQTTTIMRLRGIDS